MQCACFRQRRGRIEKPFHLRRYAQWTLKDFPDPKYWDPVHHALAASIMGQLVIVFNWRSQRGIRRDYVQTGWEAMVSRRWDLEYPSPQLETAPSWTKQVLLSHMPLFMSSGYEVLQSMVRLASPMRIFLRDTL